MDCYRCKQNAFSVEKTNLFETKNQKTHITTRTIISSQQMNKIPLQKDCHNLPGNVISLQRMNKTLFVLGAPRSGTTLLVNFLAEHQSKIFGTAYESQFYTRVKRQPYALDNYINDEYFAHVFTVEELTKLFSTSSSHQELFRNAIKLKLAESNKNVFVEKSPMHTLFYKEILNDFDNPEFIIINRNPFSNIQSIAFTKWISLPSDALPGKLKSNKGIRYFFSTFILYKYQKVVKELSQHSKCILVLSYEDIVLEKINVKQELENVLGFELDPLYVPRPYSDAVSHTNRVLDKSRIDDYKNVMPKIVQRYIKALFAPENFSDQLIRIPIVLIYELMLLGIKLTGKK